MLTNPEEMKASELRIGNFIERIESGEQLVVLGVANSWVLTNRGKLPFRCLKPIPLTEEWLLKFGFKFLKKKDGTPGVYSNGKMNLSLSNHGNVYTLKGKLIPFVHTLQNYYYYTLLTGEELQLVKDDSKSKNDFITVVKKRSVGSSFAPKTIDERIFKKRP